MHRSGPSDQMLEEHPMAQTSSTRTRDMDTGTRSSGPKWPWIVLGVLLLLLLFLLIGLLIGWIDVDFSGGNLDVEAPDADVSVDSPDVDADPGQLPDVDVDGGELPDVDVQPTG